MCVLHLVLVPQGGRNDGILIVVYEDDSFLGAHHYLSNGCQAGLFQDFPEERIGFRLVVRNQEKCPLEVVRVHLEEFDELGKLYQLIPLFCSGPYSAPLC
jgi:hypothetical protein